MPVLLACALLMLTPGMVWAKAPSATGQAAPTTGPPASKAGSRPPASNPDAKPKPAAEINRDDIGFSYRLPDGWESVPMPAAPKPVIPYPALVTAAKGDACVDVVLTAKHGDPASVVVVIGLVFSCYGQVMTTSDLANFGEGASEGMKQTFDLTAPLQATYALGSHSMWIERATGSPKDHDDRTFTFEIACTVLKKGAACWMTMAADMASLKDFEQATVSLDGETPAALVPSNVVLTNKP